MVPGSREFCLIPIWEKRKQQQYWSRIDQRIRCLAVREVDKWLTNQFCEGDPGKGKSENSRVFTARFEWWAWVDLNHRPRPYQGLLWCYMHSSVGPLRSGLSLCRERYGLSSHWHRAEPLTWLRRLWKSCRQSARTSFALLRTA